MQRKRFNFSGPAVSADQLFEPEPSLASDPAFACLVYSMVPYLGIVFIPLALALGLVSYLTSRRKAEAASQRRALFCIGASIVLLGIQLFLWWLLYFIPESGI